MSHLNIRFAVAVGACVVCSAATSQVSLPVNPPPGIFGHTSKGIPGAAEAWGRQRERQEPYHHAERAAMAKGDYREAEAVCLKAVAADKQDAESWLLLARASERLGKTDQALKAYRALVYAKGWGSNINSDPTTLMGYVLALSRASRWQEAAEIFDRANLQAARGLRRPLVDMQMDSRRPNRPVLKAAAHYVLGTRRPTFGPADPTEQVSHLKAAVAAQPRWALARFAYGRALAKAGRVAEAKEAYTRAAADASGDLKQRIDRALATVDAAHPAR
jgi:tetratricopeptide (TPR) repeat protein